MNTDNDILPLGHFRLKSSRRRKRWQRTERDKSLIRLYREYDALNSQRHKLGFERLDPPVQRGWKRFFVLCDHPMQRTGNTPKRESGFFQGILDKINTIQYSSRRDFKVKRRRRGKKVYEERPQALLMHFTFRSLKVTDEEARYFDIVTENGPAGKCRGVYAFREPWRFKLKIEPNIIRWKRIRDFDLERRIGEMDQFIHHHDLWPRMLKVTYGSYQWRYRWYWDDKSKKHRHSSLKNRSFAGILDEYLPDTQSCIVNMKPHMKPPDSGGFSFVQELKSFLCCIGRRIAKPFFKSIRKVRKVFKANLKTNFRRSPLLFCEFVMRKVQSLLRKPFLRCGIKGFSEITFKRAETSSGKVSELFQRHVEHVVRLHEPDQLNLVWIFKVCEHTVDGRIDHSENADRFGDLQARQMFRKWTLHFEVRD